MLESIKGLDQTEVLALQGKWLQESKGEVRRAPPGTGAGGSAQGSVAA